MGLVKEVNSQQEFELELRGGHLSFIVNGFVAHLYGNSRAVLHGNSSAYLYGNSRADLYGNSRAYLYEDSSAYLYEDSSAYLYGNSRAVLHGNSRAVLHGNSRADLLDFSVGHILSDGAKANTGTGAVVIYPHYPLHIKEWCALKRISITDNKIKLWKATNLEGRDFYTGKILYNTHVEITCSDWDEQFSGECGHALHLADSPSSARFFVLRSLFSTSSFRLFQVEVDIDDCVCFPGSPRYPMKIRAKKCKVVKEYPINYCEEKMK